jgi:Holliday junction DNA helicase RuvA
MFSLITGTVFDKEEKTCTLTVAGLGYEVHCPPFVLAPVQIGDTLTLWIHHVVREDTEELFGFDSKETKRLFELLLSVSGVGPKTALAILSQATPETVRHAIATSETKHLISVGGIGRKTAEKLVIELRGKISESSIEDHLMADVEALEALKALGFTHHDAREALKQVPSSVTLTNDRIKASLKLLG